MSITSDIANTASEVSPDGAPRAADMARAAIPNKHLLWSFLAIGAFIIALGVTYAIHTWGAVKRDLESQLGNFVDLASQASDVYFKRYAEQLNLLGAELEGEGGLDNIEPALTSLARFQLLNRELLDVFVIGPNRQPITPKEPTHKSPLPMEDPLFSQDVDQMSSRTELSIGHPYWDTAHAAWLVPMGKSIKSGAKPASLTLVVLVKLADLQGLWKSANLPEGSVIGLLRDDGYIQSRLPDLPDLAPIYRAFHGGYLHEKLIREKFPTSGMTEGYSEIAKTYRFLGFRRLSSQPMTTYLTIPRSALWTAWRQRVQVPFILFSLLLLGSALVAYFGFKRERQVERMRRDSQNQLLARESKLRQQTALLQATQRTAQIGGWEIDVESKTLYWTRETYRIHDVSPETFSPTLESAIAFYAPASRQVISSAVEASLRDGASWDLELELITAKGKHIWVRATGAVELAADGRPAKVYGAVQDVTERRAAEGQIRRLAHYDELTGLANRSLFAFHLTHAIARAERYKKNVAILFIDLDRFKNINDTLGHDVGDEVLRVIGQRLADSTRASDLVARLGGDEFVVILEQFDVSEDISEIAQKLLRSIHAPIALNGREFLMTGSIGVATYPKDGMDMQTLLRHADTAMYRAKDHGRNTFEFYAPQMSAMEIDLLSLEAQLKKAVLQSDQFILHYQPKRAVSDLSITGVEALIRWQTPAGLVPPGHFIPLAEETGLISAIGSWVMLNACRQLAEWNRAGLKPIEIAVNISARQLYGSALVEEVRSVVAETGINPSQLVLEITESAMMKNVEHVSYLLHDLKKIGVRIAVDDFGTGYSSLSYLKKLPIDQLKVDRSFVQDVPGDADDAAIVRAVIALAHSLRIDVVAEGVETEAQMEFLRSLGCDEVQGFLFNRPTAADEIFKILGEQIALTT